MKKIHQDDEKLTIKFSLKIVREQGKLFSYLKQRGQTQCLKKV